MIAVTRSFADQSDENSVEIKHSSQRLHCFFVTDTVLFETLTSSSLTAAHYTWLIKIWNEIEKNREMNQDDWETLERKRAKIRSDWKIVKRRECLRKTSEKRDDLKQTLKSRSDSMIWMSMKMRDCSERAIWIRSWWIDKAFDRLESSWNNEIKVLLNEYYKEISALQEWDQTQKTLCVEKCEKCACSSRWRSKSVSKTLS